MNFMKNYYFNKKFYKSLPFFIIIHWCIFSLFWDTEPKSLQKYIFTIIWFAISIPLLAIIKKETINNETK